VATSSVRAIAQPARTEVQARVLARPAWVLGTMIVASTIVRAGIAFRHSTASYFPDEYIYAALSRAIAHGHLAIRGSAAHFPGLLEPLVAAPLWGLFSTETAYRLVQAENALAASLAVIPIYVIARDLKLSRGYAYLCSFYALVIPMLVMIPFTISDFVAYPLALGAIAVAVKAIDRPSAKRQLVFLAFASLATLTRVEYFVLVPAYLIAAIAIERRNFLRTQRTALLALFPVAVGVVVGAVGYYSTGPSAAFHTAVVTWIPLQAFLLALVAGVLMVPGAVAGLIRPGAGTRAAFALVTGATTVLLLAQTSVVAANVGYFKERYLFVLLPLVPLAFGIYLERGKPYRLVVFGIAAAIVVAAARLPVSGYTRKIVLYDPQSLIAAAWLQARTTAATGSLLIALGATAAAIGAVVVALRGSGRLALPLAIVVALGISAAATHVELKSTSLTRATLPGDLEWIDAAAKGGVTAIATPISSASQLELQLYWNPSVNRELLLPDAIGSDAYATAPLPIGRNGAILGIPGDFLFDFGGSHATFSNASLVERHGDFALYRPAGGTPRFHLLIEGYLPDHWLVPNGRIRVWKRPGAPVADGASISFKLSLPNTRPKPAHIVLRDRTFTIHPGGSVRVICRSRSNPLRFSYASPDVVFDKSKRPLSVKLADIKVTDERPTAAWPRGATACVPAGRT
jgi:Dolichyl-phosphate-mannose-protein mannosyltransferase